MLSRCCSLAINVRRHIVARATTSMNSSPVQIQPQTRERSTFRRLNPSRPRHHGTSTVTSATIPKTASSTTRNSTVHFQFHTAATSSTSSTASTSLSFCNLKSKAWSWQWQRGPRHRTPFRNRGDVTTHCRWVSSTSSKHSSSASQNPFAVLGLADPTLTRGSGADEITEDALKMAYREACFRTHPDQVGGDW